MTSKARFYTLTQSEKTYLETMLDRWSDTSGLNQLEQTIVDRMFQPALVLNGMCVVDEETIVEEVTDPFSDPIHDDYLSKVEETLVGNAPEFEFSPVPDFVPKHVRQSSHLVIEQENEDDLQYFVSDPNAALDLEGYLDSLDTKSQQVWVG